MKLKKSILQKLKDLVSDEPGIVPTRKLGTILIILSSVLLYLDKVFLFLGYFPPMPNKYIEENIGAETYIWLIMQGFFSPIILIIGLILKPYKASLVLPFYCYSVQGFFLMISGQLVDDDGWIYVYAVVSTILIIAVIDQIKIKLKSYIDNKIATEKERILNELQ